MELEVEKTVEDAFEDLEVSKEMAKLAENDLSNYILLAGLALKVAMNEPLKDNDLTKLATKGITEPDRVHELSKEDRERIIGRLLTAMEMVLEDLMDES